MRSALVAALVSCTDGPQRSHARRFVEGLSADELRFIAEFLGACVLDSAGKPCCRAQWAERITHYRQASEESSCADWGHKMILLLEFLCRTQAVNSQLFIAQSTSRLAAQA